jgi:hypothetical protein
MNRKYDENETSSQQADKDILTSTKPKPGDLGGIFKSITTIQPYCRIRSNVEHK